MKKIMIVFVAIVAFVGCSIVNAQTKDVPVKAVPEHTAVKVSPIRDPIDTTLKGPAGEAVYTGAKGVKYYLSADKNKIYLVRNEKGPHGETIYKGAKGGKYYMTDKGVKTFLVPGKDVNAKQKK
jgi:hypothetical protein